MADNSSDGGAIGLLAFLLGGMLVLVIAVGAFMFMGAGGGRHGDQVNINLPSPPTAASGSTGGNR